ncbi:MAG TPA: EAL domain-containing protein [Gammaproteobacteria bacterium]
MALPKRTRALVGLWCSALAALAGLLLARDAGLLPAGAFWALAAAIAGGTTLGAAGLARRFAAELARPLRHVATALRAAAEGGSAELPDGLGEEAEEVRRALAVLDERLRARTVTRDYLDRLLSSMTEAMIVTDAGGKIVRANTAAVELFGSPEETLKGRDVQGLIAGDTSSPAPSTQRATPREGTARRPDGSTVSISYTVSEIRRDDGALESVVYAAQNIDERKRVEQRIRYLARTDPLTKIANRMQFQHVLQRMIARARRTQQYLAILYMDLDRFKDINDTFGHGAGDTALEIFTRRLVAELPANAHAGRLAGDEFAVLVTGFERFETMLEQIGALANRLLHAVGKPFQVHGEEVFMTSSLGVALYPRDGDNAIDLLRNADAALYQAKRAGGNCFEIYSADMNNAVVERLMLKSKLQRAFERDELRLHYQPKYSLKTGQIEGVEALVRWDLPDRGLVFPSDFIPLAEETNLILQLGDWVLDRVCADYRSWQRLVPSPCRVSLNLSLRQLQQRRFLDRVRETFRAHGVSPTSLELEITETTLMEDPERTVRILDALYGMGLNLAIDDFGTGYSSLSALQQFPINTLKIDQSFVRDVAIDKDDATIVNAIIQLAHNLKLEVVAEGVESAAQLEFLRAHGCDYAQGHLFGDPVTGEEFGRLLMADSAGSGKYRQLFA